LDFQVFVLAAFEEQRRKYLRGVAFDFAKIIAIHCAPTLLGFRQRV